MVTFSMNLSAQSYDDAVEWLNSKMKIGAIRVKIREKQDHELRFETIEYRMWIENGHILYKWRAAIEADIRSGDPISTGTEWEAFDIPISKIKSVTSDGEYVKILTFGNDTKYTRCVKWDGADTFCERDELLNRQYIIIDVSAAQHGEEKFPERFKRAMNDIIEANKKAMGINEKY